MKNERYKKGKLSTCKKYKFTGEFRTPLKNEYFELKWGNENKSIQKCYLNYSYGKYPIVKPIKKHEKTT